MPYISVIIIDFNRKKYLREAVESVLKQSLGQELFEIIVIKNYVSEIDDWLVEHRIKLIFSEESSYGKKILLGAAVARGEIISLLDDDDLFVEDKLKFIYETFNDKKNIGYCHNFYQKIDQDGKPYTKNFWFMESRRKINFVTFPSNFRRLQKSLVRGGDFNHSSISFRKVMLQGVEKYIGRVTGSFDTCAFFLSASKKYQLMFTNIPLTKYRIHSSTSSKLGTKEERAMYSLKQLKNYKVISEIVEEQKDLNLTKLINSKIYDTKITLGVLRDYDRPKILSILYQYRINTSTFSFYSNVRLLLGLSFTILPTPMKKIIKGLV